MLHRYLITFLAQQEARCYGNSSFASIAYHTVYYVGVAKKFGNLALDQHIGPCPRHAAALGGSRGVCVSFLAYSHSKKRPLHVRGFGKFATTRLTVRSVRGENYEKKRCEAQLLDGSNELLC